MGDFALWSALRRAGQSRFLKTAYIWLFVVPVAARILQAAPATVRLVWPGEFDLQLALPFSWRCFYWSALFVAAADFVFWLRCPSIVKDHLDKESFVRAGKQDFHVVTYQQEIRPSYDPEPEDEPPEDITFWSVHHEADRIRRRSRFACAMLYLVGFALFLVVAGQNLLFVVMGFP